MVGVGAWVGVLKTSAAGRNRRSRDTRMETICSRLHSRDANG